MKKLAIILLAIFVIASPLRADSIGFVDLQKVFLEYSETKSAQKDFDKKQTELKKEFEKRRKKIEKARKKNKSDTEIQKLIEKLEEELEPKRKELIELNKQLMGKIRQDILTASEKVAKEYGIDVIVDKSAVLYGGFDLTNFVIDKLNK